MQCYFIAALSILMKRVHCDMRLSLFKSWQHSVTTLVGWLVEVGCIKLDRKREIPLVEVFRSLHNCGRSCLSEKEVAQLTFQSFQTPGSHLFGLPCPVVAVGGLA